MRTDALDSLVRLAPRSAPVLNVLADAGVLSATCADEDQPAVHILLRILRSPRHALFDARHVYWSLLERLVNPATVTQRIAIPFLTGEMKARTCVSASLTFALAQRHPAAYLHMVEGLTGPIVGFEIVRRYPNPEVFRARVAWLSGFHGDRITMTTVAPDALRILVRPDESATGRAAEEHSHRRHQRYYFGDAPRGDTRKIVDVLLQSAITNYVLQGNYVAAADVDQRRGQGGVPLPITAEDRYARDCMQQDLLNSTGVVE